MGLKVQKQLREKYSTDYFRVLINIHMELNAGNVFNTQNLKLLLNKGVC